MSLSIDMVNLANQTTKALNNHKNSHIFPKREDVNFYDEENNHGGKDLYIGYGKNKSNPYDGLCCFTYICGNFPEVIQKSYYKSYKIVKEKYNEDIKLIYGEHTENEEVIVINDLEPIDKIKNISNDWVIK